MTAYLLDTNVISMFGPNRPTPDMDFVNWLRDSGGQNELFLSAVSISEIQKGIAKLVRKNSDQKAELLANWLKGLIQSFGPAILPVDVPTALVAGDLEDQALSIGQNPGTAAIFIAATAKAHNLVLVTNNRRHFDFLGIAVQGPQVTR